jgi:pimeloyl-ACP methyl ester carboxylesterase
VLWSTRDPYTAPEFGPRYAEALGGDVTLEEVDAGHWPWLERPELVDRVAEFLG